MLLTNIQNNTDIALIVSRSRYLAERLSFSVTTTDNTDSKNEAKITERLEQWCQIVAQGNFAQFEKRLAWAGLDIKTIHPLLVDSDRNLSQPLPPWATTLAQIIEKAQTLSHEQRLAPQRYLNIKEPVPFEQMYRFLSDRQEFLSSSDSSLTIFADLKVRYVFRATRTYNSILRGSLTPELLQSGIDRSINLNVLSRAFVLPEQKPDFWSILDAELRAIERLDIPFQLPTILDFFRELRASVINY